MSHTSFAWVTDPTLRSQQHAPEHNQDVGTAAESLLRAPSTSTLPAAAEAAVVAQHAPHDQVVQRTGSPVPAVYSKPTASPASDCVSQPASQAFSLRPATETPPTRGGHAGPPPPLMLPAETLSPSPLPSPSPAAQRTRTRLIARMGEVVTDTLKERMRFPTEAALQATGLKSFLKDTPPWLTELTAENAPSDQLCEVIAETRDLIGEHRAAVAEALRTSRHPHKADAKADLNRLMTLAAYVQGVLDALLSGLSHPETPVALSEFFHTESTPIERSPTAPTARRARRVSFDETPPGSHPVDDDADRVNRMTLRAIPHGEGNAELVQSLYVMEAWIRDQRVYVPKEDAYHAAKPSEAQRHAQRIAAMFSVRIGQALSACSSFVDFEPPWLKRDQEDLHRTTQSPRDIAMVRDAYAHLLDEAKLWRNFVKEFARACDEFVEAVQSNTDMYLSSYALTAPLRGIAPFNAWAAQQKQSFAELEALVNARLEICTKLHRGWQ